MVVMQSQLTPQTSPRILLPSDREQIHAFSKERLQRRLESPMEAEMQSWNSPWRLEALDHYLP